MTGVEVPDYSGVFVFVCIIIALAAMLCRAARSDTRQDEKRSLKNMEDRMGKWYGTPQRKSPNCGFIKPGEWFCNCGKSRCKAFGEFRDAMEALDGTPPVHPRTDRRAAIEHSRNK